jgi:hypothetical protein
MKYKLWSVIETENEGEEVSEMVLMGEFNTLTKARKAQISLVVDTVYNYEEKGEQNDTEN